MLALKASESLTTLLKYWRNDSLCLALKDSFHREQKHFFSRELRKKLEKYIFLPTYCFKLVRTTNKLKEGVVRFYVPMTFSKFEIINYLEQIYNVQVAKVSVEIRPGECIQTR